MNIVLETLQFRAQASVLQITRRWQYLAVLLLTLGMLFAACPAYCTDYYVSPTGDDGNDGTIGSPFRTITKAHSVVVAGDTIFLRGGTHSYNNKISISKSGASGNLITLQNYQNESVILDYSDQPYGSSYRGINLSASYWYFKGFTIEYAGDNGINVTGSHNTFEQLVFRYNADSGFQLHTGSSYNTIINCDSYENYDAPNNGENADGFAAKFSLGLGNKFVGCRAWGNSDDGYDLWEAGSGVTLENCWAFWNGENIWGDSSFQGDGNGFKLGHGSGAHILIRCVAYENMAHGIDINGNSTGVLVYNCTCVANWGNFNFDESAGTHVLRNNLSHWGWVYVVDEVDDEYNSWNGFTVDDTDFVSLDSTGIDGPREPDGGLPKLDFLRLAPTSWLIDAGIDVGEPFYGDAPDLGAFEYEHVAIFIFVDQAATGANDGSSWEDAYTSLQDALDDAYAGDQIWVADGIYTPAEPGGDRYATFQLKSGVAIKGGYAGYGAADPNERDPNVYQTILSGDLNGDDGPDFANNGENSYNVVTGSGTNATAVLDGFTITGGNSNSSGGGMYNYNGSPTVSNCTFSGNSAYYGGGMYNYYYSSPTLTNCTFSGNSADYGGGMRNYYYSSPMLTNCTFSNNSGGYVGGGMYNYYSSPALTNCTFSGNSVKYYGGGMYNYYSSPTLTNCTFSTNSAIIYTGGGMYNYYYSNPTLTNCTFSGNTAEMSGGGMYNSYYSSPALTNCTFSGNLADYGGGMYNYYYSNPTLTNCILWGNTAPSDPQIYNDGTSSVTVSYSDVQGGWPGTGNINADPCFVALGYWDPNGTPTDANDDFWVEGDYHLTEQSPCIDAGDNTAVPAGVTTDLDGNPRIRGPAVDMGAYESPAVLFVDVDAAGANDGSSWEDAYNYLQDALSVEWWVDEIRVAEGVYKPDEDTTYPDGSGDRAATFQLKTGAVVKGGYAGYGAPDPNERDPNAYETILSGDLKDNDGPDFANNGENSYNVVTGSNTDSTAVIDGFTITAGDANGASDSTSRGGGMLNYPGSPTVTNCVFSGNSGGNGGAVYNLRGGSPTMTNCTFISNRAGGGAGMWNNKSHPTLTNCTFIGNSVSGNGGAIYNHPGTGPDFGSNPVLINCTFTNNTAGSRGGAMYNRNGKQTLTNCTFNGNSAYYGGGMSNFETGSPTVTNCTFSNNSAYVGGGMFNDGSPTVTNCILWGNTAPSGPQIYNDGTSSATVSYSDVQGGWPGTGNINLDPLFIDASNGDLHLLSGSPCINAGDPNYVAGPNETDLDGLPRVIGGRIDMGAYEFNHQPVADAGPNQIAYAWIDGFADVNLDGSGSYDDDNDVLDYYWSWMIDGNDYEANGVSPTISLPVGEHTIELVVDDGSDESEPNYCTIEVIAPLQAKLFCIPCTLNWKTCCRGKLITLISMPPGIRKADIDLTEPLIFYPGQIESRRQFAFELGHRWHRRTYVWASFDKSACIEHLEPGFNRVNVVGKLTSGRYYDAVSCLRLVPARWHHWPYPICHGRK